jgi:MbtH protein
MSQASFSVVINAEEQYSVWPLDRELPPGWRHAGKAGTREACLEHIATVWTDMRPRSLRKHMQAQQEAARVEPA